MMNFNENFSVQISRNLNGQAMEKIGEIGRAIKEYEKNISEGFEGNCPYDRLAIIYRKLKDYNSEIRVLNRGIEIFTELSETSKRSDLQPKMDKFKKRLEQTEELKKNSLK